jgi:hypothetical protein
MNLVKPNEYLLFGCSERAGRWRGGLPPGTQLGGNGGRALRRLELKQRERRMGGCVGAVSTCGRGGGCLDGVPRGSRGRRGPEKGKK